MVSSEEEKKIQQVWNKGKVVSGYDAEKWRKDECDAWISRKDYGDRKSIYGWEIHHVKTDSDDVSNLDPLQWENNVVTSDKKKLTCAISSEGNKNIKK